MKQCVPPTQLVVWCILSLYIGIKCEVRILAPEGIGHQTYPSISDFMYKPYAKSVLLCVMDCIDAGSCAGVYFDKESNRCLQYYNSSVSTERSVLREMVFHRTDYVYIDEWILAYRLVSGAGGTTYPQYMDDGFFNDPNIMSPGCFTLEKNHTCNKHFKSRIVTRWDQENIDVVRFDILTKKNPGFPAPGYLPDTDWKLTHCLGYVLANDYPLVKVVLITDTTVIKEILFDGTGSDKVSWFSKDRLLSSSWNDLPLEPTVTFFSIAGYSNFRKWYIHSNQFGSCGNDRSWLMVVDVQKTGACAWDNTATLPQLYYSTQSTMSTAEGWALADVMAVLVKVKSS